MIKKNESVYKFTENKCDTSAKEKYCAILGLSPSKGARSPLLWNAAFAAHKMEVRMLPMDVRHENLPALLHAIEDDASFIGGAIAVPYKENVAKWLGNNISTEAASIGAVNCIYRKNGKLYGTNTDGEASLLSYINSQNRVLGKSVLLLGPGGAGKAVSTFFSRVLGPTGSMTIAARSDNEKNFANRIGANFLEWKSIKEVLPTIEILINCTSVGFLENKMHSPITSDEIALLRKDAVVYDIIYQPTPTILLKLARERNLVTLDGNQMNLKQAELAFNYAMSLESDNEITKFAMRATK